MEHVDYAYTFGTDDEAIGDVEIVVAELEIDTITGRRTPAQ